MNDESGDDGGGGGDGTVRSVESGSGKSCTESGEAAESTGASPSRVSCVRPALRSFHWTNIDADVDDAAATTAAADAGPTDVNAAHAWSPRIRWTHWLRVGVLSIVHGVCRLHAQFNDIRVWEGQRLLEHVDAHPRARTQSVLTVANHQSTMDDPYLISALLPWSTLTDAHRNRWSWCASEICFKHAFVGTGFRLGKVFPITRGQGLHQVGMDEALAHLRRGEWVHVFPEGRCSPHVGLQPLRWGVGKLITETTLRFGLPAPIVIPIVHRGMDAVMPLASRVPRINKRVRVLVGEPIHVDDLIHVNRQLQWNNPGWGDPWPPADELLYTLLTQRIATGMQRTEAELLQRMREEDEEDEKQRASGAPPCAFCRSVRRRVLDWIGTLGGGGGGGGDGGGGGRGGNTSSRSVGSSVVGSFSNATTYLFDTPILF